MGPSEHDREPERAPLREDVRRLDSLVGDVLQEQGGKKLLSPRRFAPLPFASGLLPRV